MATVLEEFVITLDAKQAEAAASRLGVNLKKLETQVAQGNKTWTGMEQSGVKALGALDNQLSKSGRAFSLLGGAAGQLGGQLGDVGGKVANLAGMMATGGMFGVAIAGVTVAIGAATAAWRMWNQEAAEAAEMTALNATQAARYSLVLQHLKEDAQKTAAALTKELEQFGMGAREKQIADLKAAYQNAVAETTRTMSTGVPSDENRNAYAREMAAKTALEAAQKLQSMELERQAQDEKASLRKQELAQKDRERQEDLRALDEHIKNELKLATDAAKEKEKIAREHIEEMKSVDAEYSNAIAASIVAHAAAQDDAAAVANARAQDEADANAAIIQSGLAATFNMVGQSGVKMFDDLLAGEVEFSKRFVIAMLRNVGLMLFSKGIGDMAAAIANGLIYGRYDGVPAAGAEIAIGSSMMSGAMVAGKLTGTSYREGGSSGGGGSFSLGGGGFGGTRIGGSNVNNNAGGTVIINVQGAMSSAEAGKEINLSLQEASAMGYI